MYFLIKGLSPHTEAYAPFPRALENKVCNEKINGAFLISMACVFLIIFLWMQSLALVPKPYKASPCFSESKETLLGLMRWSEASHQPPVESNPPLLFSSRYSSAQTPSLSTCPFAVLLTSFTTSTSFPYNLSHILQHNQVFLEQNVYHLTALLKHRQQICYSHGKPNILEWINKYVPGPL